MLAKKYSDTGGLLSEEDAQLLTRKYTQLAEQQSKYTRLEAKTKKNKKEQDKVDGLLSDLAELRREIVDLETAYSSVFNHTADTKAQNKVILWYLVNLSYYQENEDDDINSFFIGEALEDKIDEYYKIDEEGHDLFDVAKHKLMSFISFWYFSSGASKEDFDSLNKDIEEGNV
jgi:allophanate hydrolase subunit 1